MVFESFDASNGEELILSEFHMLKQAKVVFPSGNINLDHLDYDDRVKLFQYISKTALFHTTPIKLSDLIYWFPECQQSVISKNIIFSSTSIETNLEIILAEIMEGNFQLEHFFE